VIEAPSNDVAVLRPLMSAVREAISKVQPGVVTRVHGWQYAARRCARATGHDCSRAQSANVGRPESRCL